jgi:hypothetical protein
MEHTATAQSENSHSPVATGPAARTALTLLLIFHLFAVAIGVLSRAQPVSPLRNQLADVPFIRHYLQLLHLDFAYNFHLTDGTVNDVDHFVVVDRADAAKREERSPEGIEIQLPPIGIAPGIRRERYQQLALLTAVDQLARPRLSAAIGGGLLRHAHAPEGTYRFRIRRQMLVAREDTDLTDPSRSGAYAEERMATAYEGAILFDDPQAEFIEIAPEQERAGLREGEVPSTPDGSN